MLWIILAILAHVGNGLVFIVDKSLLKTKTAVGNPVMYALYSAGFAGLSLLLFPWAHISVDSFLLLWSFVAGAIHIGALYVFFTAMQKGEPSRIVPITGSAVPLFTVIFALTFLGEQFTAKEGFGVALLIAGGMMLVLRTSSPTLLLRKEKGVASSFPLLLRPAKPWRSGDKERLGEVMLPVVAGLLFAAYFAITKYIYNHEAGQFLGIFIVTRVAEAMIALVGILVLLRVPLSQRWERARVRAVAHRSSRRSTPSNLPAGQAGSPLVRGRKLTTLTSVAFIFNKTLAAGAFLLQTYAISLGSVSVVNALQGVQYAFVLILAVIVSLFFPKLFTEEIGRGAVIQKIGGIVLVSCGVVLLV